MIKPAKILLTVFFTAALAGGCEERLNDASGSLDVYLFDAPAQYEQVYLDIERVEVSQRTLDEQTEWMTLDDSSQRIELLDLVNGNQARIAEGELQEGGYEKLRVVLGDGNTVVVNGVERELTLVEEQADGIEVDFDEFIEAGFSYTLLMDLDAGRSISEHPEVPNRFVLDPVVRIINEAVSGTIQGSIEPVSQAGLVYAIAGEDTVTATYADGEGGFMLRGLPGDAYHLVAKPRQPEDYETVQIEEVTVEQGEDTMLETITLPQSPN